MVLSPEQNATGLCFLQYFTCYTWPFYGQWNFHISQLNCIYFLCNHPVRPSVLLNP